MNNAVTKNHHLSVDLLTRALDEELSTAERLEVEGHLAVCEFCRSEVDSLRQVSLAIESLVDRNAARLFSPSHLAIRRREMEAALEALVEAKPTAPNAGHVMKRFGWGVGIAATLAFGILLAPRGGEMTAPITSSRSPELAQVRSFSAQPATIEVDGESFTPLPYSNPDFPVSDEEHIVQMQVPVASLADVGIILEPVVSRIDRSEDATVLADVLLGSDGQPRGVHVLGSEQ